MAEGTCQADEVKVPRPFTNLETQNTCSLHMFCVASKVSYAAAAAAVLSSANGLEISVQLVHAKSQVSTLKNIIPALGLLIYCTGAHLTASVRQHEFSWSMNFFLDNSTMALCWKWRDEKWKPLSPVY